MLRFYLLGYSRKISFVTALNFSPDYPYPTAKFALLQNEIFQASPQQQNLNML